MENLGKSALRVTASSTSLTQASAEQHRKNILAAERAKLMLDCFRTGGANNPEVFVTAVAATLARYPDQVIYDVTDPRLGLPSQLTWMPSIKEVYDAAKAIRSKAPKPTQSFSAGANSSLPEKSSITAAPLNEIFGTQGESKDGMIKFTFGRPAKMHGVTLGNTMGVNTWAAFAGSDDNAIVDGDFAVTEDELQSVLKSLLKEKINIVAIHQHMTHEEPRIMFFHYWGRSSAKGLATAIKGGLLVGGLIEVSSPLQN